MKNLIAKLVMPAFLAAAVSVAPQSLQAQSTNKAASSKKDSAEKKASAHPIHGTLTAVDKSAKTITVGKVTYHITSDTKFKKNDKPATLEDGVVGEEVGGYVKPGADGKLVASSVRFGPKPDSKGAKKSEEKKK